MPTDPSQLCLEKNRLLFKKWQNYVHVVVECPLWTMTIPAGPSMMYFFYAYCWGMLPVPFSWYLKSTRHALMEAFSHHVAYYCLEKLHHWRSCLYLQNLKSKKMSRRNHWIEKSRQNLKFGHSDYDLRFIGTSLLILTIDGAAVAFR